MNDTPKPREQMTKAELLEELERMDGPEPAQLAEIVTMRRANMRRIRTAAEAIEKTANESCAELRRFLTVRLEGSDAFEPHPAIAAYAEMAKAFTDLLQQIMHPPLESALEPREPVEGEGL